MCPELNGQEGEVLRQLDNGRFSVRTVSGSLFSLKGSSLERVDEPLKIVIKNLVTDPGLELEWARAGFSGLAWVSLLYLKRGRVCGRMETANFEGLAVETWWADFVTRTFRLIIGKLLLSRGIFPFASSLEILTLRLAGDFMSAQAQLLQVMRQFGGAGVEISNQENEMRAAWKEVARGIGEHLKYLKALEVGSGEGGEMGSHLSPGTLKTEDATAIFESIPPTLEVLDVWGCAAVGVGGFGCLGKKMERGGIPKLRCLDLLCM
uniref:Uncharacterized protein n=1 Tax=Chromera velia CCMP2878 TaxID=1169474 RepID=A0A0G4H825_9ALVE|eukprot:Cvel_5834.t1-p1 / transcript=Cvel_5834.t1 / gene=Cvel_5834 / organism=Chromera_velia_CCMP2878 / gene_product=hypothetical protein / transcript_product=hypothetical protein / location=Cvel_scaffold277:35706-36702(-) / protein_length=263 / sequence_SO=supercontig / SO=protein_coding / is_pseudo=false